MGRRVLYVERTVVLQGLKGPVGQALVRCTFEYSDPQHRAAPLGYTGDEAAEKQAKLGIVRNQYEPRADLKDVLRRYGARYGRMLVLVYLMLGHGNSRTKHC
jgi:hypothetical protein